MKLSKGLIILEGVIIIVAAVTWILSSTEPPPLRKPVIYLYPTKEESVSIKLNFNGQLTCTYPDYKNGWKVIAAPDGTLTNLDDGKQYACLFWEGVSNETKWDLSKGFVVAGKDTKDFLQEKLAFLGLTPKEYNEFIIYWLPIMKNNQFNLVSFATTEYEELAPMQITPKPDFYT